MAGELEVNSNSPAMLLPINLNYEISLLLLILRK